MEPREEITEVRRRVATLEAELSELKFRIGELETRLGSSPLEDAGTASERTNMPAASGASVESAPVETEVPPPLPWAEPVFWTSPAPASGSVENFSPEPIGSAGEAAAPRSNPFRDWLEPLQLWPPSGEDNAEVRLAAWWATRIGALLAVIGVVFLGIYVSRNAPPWVRLAEVMTATGLALGLGAWLERKLPKFGAVVFGAGLALAYFCAFAAYGVPAMKVISSPMAATLCEVVVVAGILAVAWRRNSPVTATMAVMLGHVTAFLALREGPPGFGPWVVLLLGVAAVMLRWARAWEAPSLVALPLTWCFLLAAAFARGVGEGMSLGAVWTWTFLYFALFMLRDWGLAWRGAALSTIDRMAQVSNATLAVAVGLLAAARVGGPPLAKFYFLSGAVLLGVTWAWRKARAEALVPIFACKAAGLIALGVIAEFEGHARSLVLLAQAFVMLVSARQAHVRGLRRATVVAGVLALAFFLGDLRPSGAAVWAGATLAEAAFLAGAIAFVAALARWRAVGRTPTIVGSTIVGAASIGTAGSWATAGWAPAVDVALGLLLAVAAGGVRGGMPAVIGAVMLVLAAHLEIWNFSENTWGATKLWGNELVLLATAGVAVWALNRWEPGDEKQSRMVRGATVGVVTATFIVVCTKGLAPTAALATASGVAALLTLMASRAPRWPLAALSAPLLAFGWLLHEQRGGLGHDAWLWVAMGGAWAAPLWLTVSRGARENLQDPRWRAWTPAAQTAVATALTWLALSENLTGNGRFVGTVVAASIVFMLTWKPGLRAALEASWMLWLAALVATFQVGAQPAGWLALCAAWGPALILANVPALAGTKIPPPSWRRSAEGIQVVLASLIGVAVAGHPYGTGRVLAFSAVLGIAFIVWRWGRVASARPAVFALAGVTWLVAMRFARTTAAQGWGSGLAVVIGFATLTILLPFLLDRDLGAAQRLRLRWAMSSAGLALAFVAFVAQRGEVAHHATALAGVAAMATFIAGLLARSRPHRLCGLAGIALCIPRAFVVDLNSTLHRIVAFVALGVVLLWIGFSYHRFRHLIVDDEKKL